MPTYCMQTQHDQTNKLVCLQVASVSNRTSPVIPSHNMILVHHNFHNMFSFTTLLTKSNVNHIVPSQIFRLAPLTKHFAVRSCFAHHSTRRGLQMQNLCSVWLHSQNFLSFSLVLWDWEKCQWVGIEPGTEISQVHNRNGP